MQNFARVFLLIHKRAEILMQYIYNHWPSLASVSTEKFFHIQNIKSYKGSIVRSHSFMTSATDGR